MGGGGLYLNNHSLPLGYEMVLVVKYLPTNAGDRKYTASIPGSERSPGEGNGNPLVSILTWGIPWTEESVRLQSIEWKRVRHN